MRVIRPPREVLGEALVTLWRDVPELRNQFPDSEEGTLAFLAFVSEAVQHRLARERM